MGWQQFAQIAIAPRPFDLALGHEFVEFGKLEGRERTGETGRGAGGEHQFGPRCQLLSAEGAEAHGQAVFALCDLRRTVQAQGLEMALEIGCGDDRIERMVRREQPRTARLVFHRHQGVVYQTAEMDPRKRRLEPARADKARQLVPHLVARFGRYTFVDRVAGAIEERQDQRRSQRFCVARPQLRIGIEQAIGVRFGQPHFGQRFERAAVVQRFGQKEAVDTAGARAGDDVVQYPQPDPRTIFDGFQEAAVNLCRGG